MEKPNIVLETERAYLRPFYDLDLKNLTQMMSDPDVMKYTGFRKPQEIDAIKCALKVWKKEGNGPLGVWCAENKFDGSFIGWFMLKNKTDIGPELGFMLPKEKWGKGYATEISKEVLKYAFNQLGVDRVLATTVRDNRYSISVLSKIGMKYLETNIDSDSQYEIQTFGLSRSQYFDL